MARREPQQQVREVGEWDDKGLFDSVRRGGIEILQQWDVARARDEVLDFAQICGCWKWGETWGQAGFPSGGSRVVVSAGRGVVTVRSAIGRGGGEAHFDPMLRSAWNHHHQ